MSLRTFKLTSKLPFRRPTASKAAKSPAELRIPTHFRCPVSLDLMKDPVTLPTGITYDRPSIETWLEAGNRTCPVTNQPLALPADGDIIPNHTIRRMIQDWCVAHRSLGVERIPTPKTPITALQVSEMIAEISAASQRGDRARCGELVAKLKNRIAESERNRRCILSNGTAKVLAAVFKDFPSEQVLSVLAGILPLGEEARKQLASAESLNSIVFILRNGNLSGRLHAILVVREMAAAADTQLTAEIARTDGLVEAIVKLIKEPISPQATKASLIAAYYLASCDDRVASRLTEMGIVPVLLDRLVDAEKSLCEKGLAVLNVILSSEAGREEAAGHALTVPVLVKKMFRVSDVATEFAVSAMWKLCKKQRNGDGEKCLVEALKVGAFQKLLLLLQVGCSDSTKEKASELLRMLNGFRGRVECIEAVDFKGLKRPF